MENEEELDSLTQAMNECQKFYDSEIKASRKILFTFNLIVSLVLGIGFSAVLSIRQNGISIEIPNLLIYVSFAAFIIVFGVVMAQYRQHISEASKYAQYKLGFMRIRVAGRRSKETYQTEVRAALTAGAFDVQNSGSNLFKKEGKVSNPMPGHPGLDISTQLINKLLEKIDVSIKNEDSRTES